MAGRVVDIPVGYQPSASELSLLLRLRYVVLRNHLRQVIQQRPWRLAGTALSMLLIWAALYAVFVETFHFVNRQVLEGIAAMPVIFTFFFLAMTGMLAFSNAILCYGGLFKRPESAYLLSSPVPARDVVAVKYIESLVMSSWSLMLLGLPLMFALAHTRDESWEFYPLFLGLFVAFIPMPGAMGLVLAWLVVMFFPKTPKRTALAVLVMLALLGLWWMWDLIAEPATSQQWLLSFYDRVGLIQSAIWPHEWVAKGINQAIQGQPGAAGFYLFVLCANALFVSVVSVSLVSRRFLPAFTRAQSSGHRSFRRSGYLIGWVAEMLFAYLPWRQRLLASKDLKSFFRDPLQWSQMAILFGLLTLYVSNVQRLWLDLADPRFKIWMGFLNTTAVCLILATFTCRFVFPLVSLEGQQLWLMSLLPMKRSRIVTAKFLYALTLTLLTAMAVMSASIWRLGLSRPLAIVHIASVAAVCIGLCGVSIGMGARMPVFHERNPARIAGGFGGTISLLISVALVMVSLVGVGVMSFRATETNLGDTLSSPMILWTLFVILLNIVASFSVMIMGIRYFNRTEW